MEKQITQLIHEMSLEEKIKFLAGQDMWHTMPNERLDIPAIRVSDGPNGVRGSEGNYSPTSACFPCGAALGATWNPELVKQISGALADEARAKGVHILLAPTVNMHRSPIAGRNFECFSEDPYLTGEMASAYITGLQENGVGACIKHFVCNDQEFERHSISSEVQERPLHEIYLEPFRIAIKKAKPWSIMSAYNRINGVFANANDSLLKDILKGDWEFDGIVISDWFGTYDPSTAQGALDIEMPGPARWASSEHVNKALNDGLISEKDIDEKVRRILRVIDRAGAFAKPGFKPEKANDKPAHRKLIRKAAGEAIVMLKNNDLLPINSAYVKKLLVIGENASFPQIVGGGSAHVNAHYVISPLKGIRERAGDQVEVSYALGCVTHRSLPPIDPALFTFNDGKSGLKLSVFDNPDFKGDPVLIKTVRRTTLAWFGNENPAPGLDNIYLRLEGVLHPEETGEFVLGLHCIGQGRLLIDGQEVIPLRTYKDPSEWEADHIKVRFEKGKERRIQVDYLWHGEHPWRVLRLAMFPVIPADTISEAVNMAAKVDAVVIIAGLTNEWETEGEDRKDMRLPGAQDELIARVSATNPNTVVVLNAGSPLEMPWIESVKSVLHLWYLGQETGNALADILFGDVNPSGKLPTTFPVRYQDNPAFLNFPGENGKVLYGEGLYIGYRYYDKKDINPLFPFGHGLSYANFEYQTLKVATKSITLGEDIVVSFDLSNQSSVAGYETVQLYISEMASRLSRPEKELKAFQKVWLEPGETKKITFNITTKALSFYDPAVPGWTAEPGGFELLIGASSRDIRLRTKILLKAVD